MFSRSICVLVLFAVILGLQISYDSLTFSPKVLGDAIALKTTEGFINENIADNEADSESDEPEDAFSLHPAEHISRNPRVIHLSWNVTLEEREPDGVSKMVYLINGQFPGPTIETRPGDELVVHVHNSIRTDDKGISIHWHGLQLKGI